MVRVDELTDAKFVLISGRPCRIVSITDCPTSHNCPTVHIMGVDVTTARKPRSFRQWPQQTYSLYAAPKALVPVPMVEFIRADRLAIGDYVTDIGLLGHVIEVGFTRAGEREVVHVVAEEMITGVQTRKIMWDNELMVIRPAAWKEYRIETFPDTQLISMFTEDGMNIVGVPNPHLSHHIERFWEGGRREVWVVLVTGGVVGAYEVRELEVSGVIAGGYLALDGEGKIPDMMIKKPRGTKGDIIDDLIKRVRRFKLRVRADMGQEEMADAWVVTDVKAL